MQVLKLPKSITAPEMKQVVSKEKKVRMSYLHNKRIEAKAAEKRQIKGLVTAKQVEAHLSKTRYEKIAKRTEQMLHLD